MTDLLKMYLFRLFKDKVFWIFLGIGVLIVLLDTIFYGIATNLLKNSRLNVGNLLVISSESLGAMDLMSKPSIVGPAFCFFFLTREFHDGTIRNMILSGKKRIDIYVSAAIVALIICYLNILVDEAFVWSLGPIFGLPTGFSDAAAVGRFFCSLGIFFVLSLMFVSITVGLCFLVPNAFGSFGIFIGIVFGLTLVYTLVSVVFPLFVSNGNLSSSAYQTFEESLTVYQTTYLEGFSFSGSVDLSRFGWVSLWASLETVVVGGSFLFFGGWKFNKSDLK